MTDETNANWTAIKADYDNGALSVVSILKNHNITRIGLEHVAQREGWKRRTPPKGVGRASLISRLFKVLEQQIVLLETNMRENDMAAPGDKEVVLLGNLTRNLEKLLDLEQKEKGRTVNKTRQTNIDALRTKVAKRIEQLKNS
jgi:hypothetical protein